MKDYETLIADIRREESELNDKLTNLEFFMMTEDFTQISPEQKHLLERQHDLMAQYKTVLIQRAHRINYEHANRSQKEKIEEFAEERKKVVIPTFNTNPDLCEKCKHPTKGYSTCHDCEDGSNFVEKVINCASCRHYKKETCTHGVLNGVDCWEKRTILDGPVNFDCTVCKHFNQDTCMHRTLKPGAKTCFEARD